MTAAPEKTYCYVDETGLDHRSTTFCVSVVTSQSDREQMELELLRIEKASGKKERKWLDSTGQRRVRYMTDVLTAPLFHGKLYFALYPPTKDYLPKTVLTIARAILRHVPSENYKATVFVDGLPKSRIGYVGTALRRLSVKTDKVRGIRSETENSLIRLADALCGFVRAAKEGREDLRELLEVALEHKVIVEL